MAYNGNKQPDELTALTSLDSGDVFVVGDVSDAVETAKMITKANLITDLGASFEPLKGADDNFVTDAEKTKLANLSGTNTGDEPDASTTVAGVVEEATAAEIAAGTATGGTSARLYVNPSTLPSALTIMPYPTLGIDFNQPKIATSIASNTTIRAGLMTIPHRITVNKISIYASAAAVAGTVDLSLYSEDGQTQLFSVTTASISGAGIVTTAVSSVSLAPGNYYIAVNPNSTASVTLHFWYASTADIGTTALNGGVSSEPVLAGTATITDSTPPATITPGSLTAATSGVVVCRLDN